jgi:uncharacterized protein (DUF433 family)
MPVTLEEMLVETPGICGGKLRINGTRITVERVAAMTEQGYSAQQILESYDHLSLAQVYAALAYYHANREEVDANLAANEREFERLKQEVEQARKP